MTIIQEILLLHSKETKFTGRTSNYIPRKNWTLIEQDILALIPADSLHVFLENRPEKNRETLIREKIYNKFKTS